VNLVEGENESQQFWALWGYNQGAPEPRYNKNKEWDNWFLDLSKYSAGKKEG